MGQSKIWNNKASGITSCLFIAISIICQKLANHITTFLFRNNIASCGKNVHINRGIVYRYPNQIYFGDNIIIGGHVNLSSEHLPESILVLKNQVTIGERCNIDFTGGIIIEEGAHLAHNVRIISHDHGYDYNNIPIGKHLNIGSNAFVGSDVIILFNCNRIGKNAVIGTGSVVTKDVPDNAVVAGNPAKIIKYRNDI